MIQCQSKIEGLVVLLCGIFWSKEIHANQHHELLHVLKGKMSIDCEDGRKFPLQAGDSLLIPAGVKHRDNFNPNKDLKLQLIHFDMEQADEYFSIIQPNAITSVSGSTRNEINSILFRIRNDLNLADHDAKVNECRLNTILQLVYRHVSGNQKVFPAIGSSERLGPAVCHYLECNYNDKNLNLSTVAKHFHISGSHLSRVFHEEAGVSFINYLTDLRMREAESLLRDTYQSVAEVAYAVGYGNPNYFARIFQRRYGVPPSAYRDATCSDVKRNNSEEN